MYISDMGQFRAIAYLIVCVTWIPISRTWSGMFKSKILSKFIMNLVSHGAQLFSSLNWNGLRSQLHITYYQQLVKQPIQVNKKKYQSSV